MLRPAPFRAWYMNAVLADVEDGQRIEFPNELVTGDLRGAYLYVLVNQRPPELIEGSSSLPGSSGTLSFSRAGCEVGSRISFAVHATLGGELPGDRSVRVDGTFRGTIEAGPRTAPRIERVVAHG